MKSLSTNPNDQVNFLPDWYTQAQLRRTSIRRQTILVAMMVLGMACLWVLGNNRRLELRDYLANLNDSIATAEGQFTEVMKLQAERERLGKQVRIYRQIAQPINYSQITGTLEKFAPPEISLAELYVHTEQIEETRPAPNAQKAAPANALRGRKPAVITISYPVVVVEVEGAAPSNVDIANFYGRLTGSGLFRDVKMINSHEGEVGKVMARRFKISMQVPLNVVYKPAAGEEVAHAN